MTTCHGNLIDPAAILDFMRKIKEFSQATKRNETYFCELVLDRSCYHHEILFIWSTEGADQKLSKEFYYNKVYGRCSPMKFIGDAPKQEVR